VDALLRYLENDREEVLRFIRTLVELESPTFEKDLVDRAGRFLADHFAKLGFAIQAFPQAERGDHFLATRGAGEQVLVLVHFDTIWSRGDAAARPFRIADGRAYGPGAFDMKGGIAILSAALRAMAALGQTVRGRLAILCTSDEEVGSDTSRALIERLARESRCVLVPEPAPEPNAVITSRKGVGNSFVTIHGRAAHAGRDHAKGVSALAEAAHHILSLQGLTDYGRGTTVNVGYARGGTRVNVVPDRIELGVDFRFTTPEEGQRLERLIAGLRPVNGAATLEVTGGVNRPPLPRTAGVQALFETALDVARDLGLDLAERSTGGGSDGSFAAALGVPTLDGLGVAGDGAHALHEHVLIEALPRRAALLGHLLQRV
jgi:glutamate carboxypeptidase